MEKISGIIPANHRTKAVDVSGSQPVRPGAPAWGRPTGRVTKTSMADPLEKVSFSNLDVAVGKENLENLSPKSTYNSRGQLAKSQVIEELSKKFFEPNIKTATRDSDETYSELVQNNIQQNEFGSNRQSNTEEVAGDVVGA